MQALGAAVSAGGVALARAHLSLPRLAAECAVLPFVTAMTYALARTVVFGGRPPSRAMPPRRPRADRDGHIVAA